MSKKAKTDTTWLLQLMNEIGIIHQLTSSEFQRLLAPNLSQSEYSVLNHLIRTGDQKTPSRLARIFQMTKPSMTAIIAKLEAKKYVKVTASKEDRRKKIVSITRSGKTARNKAAAKTMPHLAELLKQVDEKQLRAILPGLQNLREVLDTRRNERDGLV